MKKVDKVERTKMIKAMEFICRHLTDEEVFDAWLMGGVADGDIKYGDLSEDEVDEYYLEDDVLKSLMGCFLRRIKYGCHAGLYCDDVVADERD